MSPGDNENRMNSPLLSGTDQPPGKQKMTPMQIWADLTPAQRQTVIQILIQASRFLTQTCEVVNNEPV